MHASLFAVGDCFGVAGAEARARSARDRLRPILEDLASMTEDPRATILRRPARAAAYLLTVTAQPRVNGHKDLSEELLEKLSRHADPVTARLSRSGPSTSSLAQTGTVCARLALTPLARMRWRMCEPRSITKSACRYPRSLSHVSSLPATPSPRSIPAAISASG